MSERRKIMKILLLGDSIRMGYCKYVQAYFAENGTDVFFPPDNGRFAQYTLRELQEWKGFLKLQDSDIDVVHWNNGLWDVAHLGVGSGNEASGISDQMSIGNTRFNYEIEPLTPPEFYGYLLKRISDRIFRLFPSAKQIFALTTPVQEALAPQTLYRFNKEIRQYNKIAVDVLGKQGIAINDLYTFAENNLLNLYRDWVHFNEEGSKMLALEIYNFLQERNDIR